MQQDILNISLKGTKGYNLDYLEISNSYATGYV